MMGADLMLEGFLGLFGTYRHYIELIKMWGIFEGLEDWIMAIGHTINSVVLAVPFVHPAVYRRIPFSSGFLKGLTFGLLWHFLVLLVLLITAFGGAKFMREFLNMPLKDHISLFLLHLLWGGVLGVLYVPKASR